ncbi:hypothetical protein [Neobacillus ginsengisoli]|uniref:Lipoprotein n=1 Tax=Neobacillus ginsengisoli TaxID=904295 RepID=A0ABT9XU24_9BACI|nr:hypothetical protein [Neobacillus ginsengisoli]MDQ0199052.1 hypothetical protein [Neobacillus ginsengisoli]
MKKREGDASRFCYGVAFLGACAASIAVRDAPPWQEEQACVSPAW